LNRLKTYDNNGEVTMNYDLKGNVTSKTDVGSTFYYNITGKPYAISGVNAGTNTAIPARSQAVTYTSFERPASISENDYEALFTYNSSGSRVKMQMRNNGSNTFARYSLGGRYELDLGTSLNKQKLYTGGDAYSAPAVYLNTGSSWQLYYICRDYLGSITHLVNSSGSVSNEYSYDAWGRLRDPSTHEVYMPGNEPALLIDRGYTGHEHLPIFGLINMNARLYDPATGRFLSPDPYIQASDFSQNFNRYAYAYNNPLIYTDPDGEWIHIVAGALVGGIANLAMNWKNIDGFWQGVAAFGVGAGAGAATAYSFGASSGVWAGLAASAAGGAAVSGTNSVIEQTGHNFQGMNNVNWGQVGINSAIGGSAGLAGGAAGYGASNMSFLVNGISSPVLRSAVVSPLAAGAGHVAGGTTANLFMGQNLGDAFSNSFQGIGKSMVIGGAIGVVATVGTTYANRVSPWTGEKLQRHHSNPKFMGGDPYKNLLI
jgi:RHS repeat-associated protein